MQATLIKKTLLTPVGFRQWEQHAYYTTENHLYHIECFIDTDNPENSFTNLSVLTQNDWLNISDLSPVFFNIEDMTADNELDHVFDFYQDMITKLPINFLK